MPATKTAKIAALPREIQNLAKILRLKIYARRAGLLGVKMVGDRVEMVMSSDVRPIEIRRLLDARAGWAISGEKLTISRGDLGEKWFENLLAAVRGMTEKSTRNPNPA